LEEDQFYRKFSEELAQASLVMEQINNKTKAELFGDTVSNRLDQVLRGRLPWGRLLRGNLVQNFGDTFTSFSPPKRKYYPSLILPTMKSLKEKVLVIGVDDSASVGESLHKEFIANVMPAAMRAAKTVVITFDAVVREEVCTTKPSKIYDLVSFKTGYHTHTSTVGLFDAVERIKPTAVVVLTDGYVDLPKKPYRNTLWCIPTGGKPQPWGRNYIMDTAW